MNLSFLKKRAKKYHILLLFLSFGIAAIAQDSIPDIDFLQHCKDADAYLLHSYTDVSYGQVWSRYKREISINNKLVVNNTTGVDQFAFLNLSEFVSNHLKEIHVKTLKADGSVVELDSSLVFQRKSEDKKFGAINYPIPGVEPGDTIETSYVYTENLEKQELSDFVNLYKSVPSLKTEYSVGSNPDLSVRYKTYNEFPEPQVVTNDTLIYCVFKMEKIKGLAENDNTCIPCELPYLYYSLEKKDSDFRTWKDVYNVQFNAITQPISFDYQKSSYYRRWKRRVIGTAKDSSNYYKFNLLHQDVQENMQMEEPKRSELLKSSGYFLKEKRFNALSIRRLYRQLLEDLEIEYWAVFARSKRAGQIDPYYIRQGEFDHIFFAYNNAQGAMTLLYPHDTYYKYQINEIPTSIYNTEAVVAKPYLTKKVKKGDKFINFDLKFAKADSVTVNTIKLPGTSVNHNFIKQIVYSKVDLEKEEAPIKYKFSISGGLYTELRSFFELLAQDEKVSGFYDALSEFEGSEEVIQVDSITNTSFKTTRPFSFTMNAEGTLEGALSYLNDSIVSISLDKLIQHSQIDSDEETTDLNYYLDYSYTDYAMFMLNFPCDIEILGVDGYDIDFKNDFGEYFFNLKLVGGNQVSLQSNYKIIKDMIPKNEYGQLKKLNQLVKEIKNKRLIIKLKNL